MKNNLNGKCKEINCSIISKICISVSARVEKIQFNLNGNEIIKENLIKSVIVSFIVYEIYIIKGFMKSNTFEYVHIYRSMKMLAIFFSFILCDFFMVTG